MNGRKKPIIIPSKSAPSASTSTESTFSQPDHIFKFTLLGDSSVGKTKLIYRYADDTYTDNYLSSIGVDFKIRDVKVDDKTVKTQVWDAPNPRFKSIESNRRPNNAYIICFDLTNRVSLITAKQLLRECESYAGNASIILVGTKSDDVNNRVPQHYIDEFMDECGDKIDAYVETSAKTGENVQLMFETAAKCALSPRIRHLSEALDKVEKEFNTLVDNMVKQLPANKMFMGGRTDWLKEWKNLENDSKSSMQHYSPSLKQGGMPATKNKAFQDLFTSIKEMQLLLADLKAGQNTSLRSMERDEKDKEISKCLARIDKCVENLCNLSVSGETKKSKVSEVAASFKTALDNSVLGPHIPVQEKSASLTASPRSSNS